MDYVLILGATSDIGKAVAHEYAKNGYSLYLAGRDKERISIHAGDLDIRYGVNAKPVEFDALNFDSHAEFYSALDPKPIGVVCVFGYLGDHKKSESDFAEAKRIIDTNYTGCVSILNIIANDFEGRKNGFITGVSSVAGDRGRQSNYMYGSSKAAFSAYLSGLRCRLYKSGINVLTVKPGFVRTKMTEHLELPKNLTASPELVARDIFKAQQKKKDVLYTKCIWKLVMFIIVHIPERVFKRLKI